MSEKLAKKVEQAIVEKKEEKTITMSMKVYRMRVIAVAVLFTLVGYISAMR
jgi:hypothetical protein